MSSKSAAFRRLSARRTALLKPGPCGIARAVSIAITAFFQDRTLMAKSLLIRSEHLCLVAMVRASISRLRAHQPPYSFITAMLLEPAKAFRQLPQIVSIWRARRSVSSNCLRIGEAVSDKCVIGVCQAMKVFSFAPK
jgi:hypothetical protein